MIPGPVVLVSRTAAHEVLFLLASVVLGAAYTFGTPAPASVAATQPLWVIRAWAVGMILSGVFGLAGCFWRTNIARALLLERSGMYFGAATMLVYTVSLFGYAGWRAIGSGVFFGFWAVANLWRAFQISRDLGRLR